MCEFPIIFSKNDFFVLNECCRFFVAANLLQELTCFKDFPILLIKKASRPFFSNSSLIFSLFAVNNEVGRVLNNCFYIL